MGDIAPPSLWHTLAPPVCSEDFQSKNKEGFTNRRFAALIILQSLEYSKLVSFIGFFPLVSFGKGLVLVDLVNNEVWTFDWELGIHYLIYCQAQPQLELQLS